MKQLFFGSLALLSSLSCAAQTMSGLCMIAASQSADKPPGMQMMLSESNCDRNNESCMETSRSSIDWKSWTGITPQSLQEEGSQVSARMTGDAGDFVCEGVVHDATIEGRFHFNASPSFPASMAAMGFDGITPRKQLSFLMLDVSMAWVKQMQSLGLSDLSTNKLISLRALHVDADYIHAMAAAGYPELRANKLTEMKAVGVTPEKAREAKAMGFEPTEQELIQMSIFKIDKPFVDRMRARGLNDLTLAKLIKIKIFKLEE
jgi:hypothetical protein